MVSQERIPPIVSEWALGSYGFATWGAYGFLAFLSSSLNLIPGRPIVWVIAKRKCLLIPPYYRAVCAVAAPEQLFVWSAARAQVSGKLIVLRRKAVVSHTLWSVSSSFDPQTYCEHTGLDEIKSKSQQKLCRSLCHSEPRACTS